MTNDHPLHNIQLYRLEMDASSNDRAYSREIFSGKIDGLSIFHKSYTSKGHYQWTVPKNCAVFLIVLQGSGKLVSDRGHQILEKEALVVIPSAINKLELQLKEGEPLHFLEFRKIYSAADKVQLQSSDMPASEFYFARFKDCVPYTEKIKSPNTISRTVLPNNIIPRVALGTVESLGPDKVGAHSHPMLEQLFLGLADNEITVFADDSICKMGEFSLLHIPLGSTHWVEVAAGYKMNYMWMDFFLTKAGEAWLDTHKHLDK